MMPDWHAPFTWPKMSKEEFLKRKAEYIAKNGYTITIPGFEDIIHLGTYKEVTEVEQIEWRKKNWDYFSEERLEELKYVKKRNKDRFLAMLGSPTPDVFNNHASLMTALDDAQDAIATIAALGKIAVSLIPRTVAKIIQGPLGWLLLGNDVLNFAMATQRLKLPSRVSKRIKDSFSDGNPFTKKAQAKRVKRIRKGMPGSADVIQGLQTTDQVFGVGVSLGAVMALPIQIIAGNVRRFVLGQPVTVKYPIPDISHWGRLAQKMLFSGMAYWGVPHFSDDVLHSDLLITQNLATQIYKTEQVWDPVDNIGDLDEIEIKAPSPTNLMTLEIYEEEGLNPEDFVGWPALNRKWATMDQIGEATSPKATDNLKRYCERNQSNFMGLVTAKNAVDSGMNAIETIEGPDSVSYDYTMPCKGVHRIQSAGLYFPEDTTPYHLERITNYLEWGEKKGWDLSAEDIERHCKNVIAWPLLTRPPWE